MIGFSKLKTCAQRFLGSEDGNASIEFVIVFPVFMLFIISAWESGILATRHVMLERGVDETVREIRIGQMVQPDHDAIAERICEYARIIPDCKQNLRLEMVSRDPRNWVNVNNTIACVDREEEGDPVLNFTNGGNNQLMILRACSLFDPLIPTAGLGRAIPKKSGGAYALVATSSYVMEPFQ